MKTHEFSIIASGLDHEAEDFESRFYDAGCSDATIAFQKGHIIVDFAREAASIDDAISTAIDNVQKAGAKVDRVEPDPLVSLADMASRAGVSRTTMTNYFKGKRQKNFPAPTARVTSETPLWDWPTVSRWMFENKTLDLESALSAEIISQANRSIAHGEDKIADKLKKRAAEYTKELEAA